MLNGAHQDKMWCRYYFLDHLILISEVVDNIRLASVRLPNQNEMCRIMNISLIHVYGKNLDNFGKISLIE